MAKVQIPQEENATLGGIRKVMYAPSEDGRFTRHNYGSSVEEFATKVAVQEYEKLESEALRRIADKEGSAIAYFMYKNRMDLPTLASVTGLFQFQIKRHCKYRVFVKLKDKTLQKYADAFNITVAQLKGCNDAPGV